jgi:excisionase family DNA binding protein
MKTVFSTLEAAKVCKVSEQAVIQSFDSGQLKGYRLPGSRDRRIPRESLLRFMEENGIPTDDLDREGTAEGSRTELIQPATFRVDSRTFTISNLPLPFRNSGPGAGPPATLVQPGPHALVIKPQARVYRRMLAFFVAGLVGVTVFGTAAAFPQARPRLIPLLGDQLPTWLLALLACFSLLWLLLWRFDILFGGRRVRFDTSAGRMTWGPIWSRQSRALSAIVAVQLLKRYQVNLYQMNLVLDDRNTPRIQVANAEDQAWAQDAGEQLAAFLGVRLVDQTPKGKGAAEKAPT